MAARNGNKAEGVTPSDKVAENQKILQAEAVRRALVKEYRAEEQVPMYLSPMYKPYFGNVMRVSINGISIFFKVDGSTQMIPQTFADEIDDRRRKIDAILQKQNQMSDIQANGETSPGEVSFF